MKESAMPSSPACAIATAPDKRRPPKWRISSVDDHDGGIVFWVEQRWFLFLWTRVSAFYQLNEAKDFISRMKRLDQPKPSTIVYEE